MIALTKEQSEAVHQNGSSWTHVVDPGLTDDFIRDFEPLVAELSPEDWEDPSNYPIHS